MYLCRWLLIVLVSLIGTNGIEVLAQVDEPILPTTTHEPQTIQQPQLDSAYGAAWSPDGRILAVSSHSGLWFYDFTTGTLESAPHDLAFNGWTSDNRIFTGFGFFNLLTQRIEDQFDLQRQNNIFSTSIGLSRDTKTIAVLEGAYLDTIAVYDTTRGELIRRIETGNPNAGPQIAWSPDNSHFAMLRPNKPSVLLIPNTDKPTITEYLLTSSTAYRSNQLPIHVKWSPNGQLLAIGAAPSTTFILDIQSGKFVGTLEGQAPVGMAWSPDAVFLAVADGVGTISLFDVKKASVIEHNYTSGYNWSIEFSPFGGQLAVANDVMAAKQNRTQVGQQSQLNVQQSDVYVRSIGIDNAVQLFVPIPSLKRLKTITETCGVKPNIHQALISLINANDLTAFTKMVSALTDDQSPAGCKADLLAVAEALEAKSQ